jgi:hypothetical protein
MDTTTDFWAETDAAARRRPARWGLLAAVAVMALGTTAAANPFAHAAPPTPSTAVVAPASP